MREELISEALVEKIMGWRHTGFSVHSKVRAKTREEAERVGKYMIRPLLSLQRLFLDEREGEVCYRYGEDPEEVERMDKHPFIITFITDYAVVDRIIHHLKLTFVAERPPPPHRVSQQFFLDSEAPADYFS